MDYTKNQLSGSFLSLPVIPQIKQSYTHQLKEATNPPNSRPHHHQAFSPHIVSPAPILPPFMHTRIPITLYLFWSRNQPSMPVRPSPDEHRFRLLAHGAHGRFRQQIPPSLRTSAPGSGRPLKPPLFFFFFLSVFYYVYV